MNHPWEQLLAMTHAGCLDVDYMTHHENEYVCVQYVRMLYTD